MADRLVRLSPGARSADLPDERSELGSASGDEGSVGARLVRWWPVAMWMVVEWTVIDGLQLAVSRPWRPVNDWAIIDDQVRSVGVVTPLIGAFSRYGWRHPGPWMFWVLAVPYRLGGSSPNAILVGAALLNAAALAGIA